MTRNEASPNTAELSLSSDGTPALPRREHLDEPDPELLSLPDPPKRGRTVTLVVLALTAIVSIAMVFALRRDVAYAVSASSPAEVGDLSSRGGPALTQFQNAYVSARGMLGAGGGILFERFSSTDSFRAMPVAGRGDVWVEVRVPQGKENARWEPPRTFTGRLVRFNATGPRHRGLADAIARATGQQVSDSAWLLVDGESPASSRWAGALAVLFVAFAAWNLAAMVRLARNVR